MLAHSAALAMRTQATNDRNPAVATMSDPCDVDASSISALVTRAV